MFVERILSTLMYSNPFLTARIHKTCRKLLFKYGHSVTLIQFSSSFTQNQCIFYSLKIIISFIFKDIINNDPYKAF